MQHAEHDRCMAWKGSGAPALPPQIPPWLFLCRVLRGMLASCEVLSRIQGACCHSCHSQSSQSSQKHLRISHAKSIATMVQVRTQISRLMKTIVRHCHSGQRVTSRESNPSMLSHMPSPPCIIMGIAFATARLATMALFANAKSDTLGC